VAISKTGRRALDSGFLVIVILIFVIKLGEIIRR